MTYISHSVYRLDQIDRIPSKPGLYCWLARPDLDRYSWERQDAETDAERTSCLLEELATFSAASGLQPVQSEVTAFFDSSWSGKLDYTSNRQVEEKASKALKSACKNDEERRLLVDLISESFPLFWQPLYVGVAINLSTRLSTHKRVLNGAKLEGFPTTDNEKEDLATAKDLGERLRACGYRPEQLWVHALAVDHSELAFDEARTRQIAGVAENWLNLLNTPKLGRA